MSSTVGDKITYYYLGPLVASTPVNKKIISSAMCTDSNINKNRFRDGPHTSMMKSRISFWEEKGLIGKDQDSTKHTSNSSKLVESKIAKKKMKICGSGYYSRSGPCPGFHFSGQESPEGSFSERSSSTSGVDSWSNSQSDPELEGISAIKIPDQEKEENECEKESRTSEIPTISTADWPKNMEIIEERKYSLVASTPVNKKIISSGRCTDSNINKNRFRDGPHTSMIKSLISFWEEKGLIGKEQDSRKNTLNSSKLVESKIAKKKMKICGSGYYSRSGPCPGFQFIGQESPERSFLERPSSTSGVNSWSNSQSDSELEGISAIKIPEQEKEENECEKEAPTSEIPTISTADWPENMEIIEERKYSVTPLRTFIKFISVLRRISKNYHEEILLIDVVVGILIMLVFVNLFYII